MAVRFYVLSGRFGVDGAAVYDNDGRSPWPAMKKRAMEMRANGEVVQVWRADKNGIPLRYDNDATRQLTDHITQQQRCIKE